jgi:hypothetical protein
MSAAEFLSREPRLEDYWRGIILFGRNVASYKFALAKTLLDLNAQSGQLLKLSELAPVFAKHIAEHLKIADKQATSASSQFLDACRKFNSGDITQELLTEETVRRGFANVIDAFHVVNQGPIPTLFFTDERTENSGIRITDEFSKLLKEARVGTLRSEVESRWRLVETSWELGIGRNLMGIDYDATTEQLLSVDRLMRRKAVTSSRSALNGYQKGKCFYCFGNIMQADDGTDTDVDHFFPHALKQAEFGASVDGIWNLVLSCPACNRGPMGKFARIPSIRLLERLHKRNEFLISSHHPLRETLIAQTGVEVVSRIAFLNRFHDRALAIFLHSWESKEHSTALF